MAADTLTPRSQGLTNAQHHQKGKEASKSPSHTGRSQPSPEGPQEVFFMKATGISDVRTETIAVLSQPQDQLVFTEQLLCTRPCCDRAHSCQGAPMPRRGHFLPISFQ